MEVTEGQRRPRRGWLTTAAALVGLMGLVCVTGASPAWAATPTTNGMLGYTSCTGFGIFTINPDGSTPAGIWPDVRSDVGYGSLTFSPDGNRMVTAYKSGTDQAGYPLTGLEMLTLTGDRVRTIVDGPSTNWDPSFSPDGTVIAFVSNRDTPPGTWQGELYVADLATGNQTRLTHFDGYESRPEWSPDGKKIVFSRTYGGSSSVTNLFMIDVATGTETQLTDTRADEQMEATFSPDGQRLVFSFYATYVMRLDGSEPPQRLTFSAAVESRPVWSPDGQRIAFVRGNPPGTQIFTMAAAGGDEHAITDNHIFVPAEQSPCLNDWQACTAGVTVRCVSQAPSPIPGPTSSTPAPTPTPAPAPLRTPPRGPVRDTMAPRIKLTRLRADTRGHVTLRVRCSELCRLIAHATGELTGRRHTKLRSRWIRVTLAGRRTRTLRLALATHRRRHLQLARVTVSGAGKDQGGNTRRFRHSMRL